MQQDEKSPKRNLHLGARSIACILFARACRDGNCSGGLSHSSHRDHASHTLTDLFVINPYTWAFVKDSRLDLP